jgi:hypothetical protein
LQKYFGVLPTYILVPQWQKVRPEKSCTGRRAMRGFPFRFSARRAFAARQSSSGMMASTPEVTHSCSGFRTHFLPSPRDFV